MGKRVEGAKACGVPVGPKCVVGSGWMREAVGSAGGKGVLMRRPRRRRSVVDFRPILPEAPGAVKEEVACERFIVSRNDKSLAAQRVKDSRSCHFLRHGALILRP